MSGEFQLVRIRLRPATPLLMGGAEPLKFELRTTAIKGLMRFWFRCAAFPYVKNEQELYRRESEVFGGFVEEKGEVRSIPSPFDLLISDKKASLEVDSSWCYFAFPYRKKEKKEGIKEDFTLAIRGEREKLLLPLASLWLLLSLGGAGARWRRGFGSLEVLEVKPEFPEIPSFENPIERLPEGIERIRRIFKERIGGEKERSSPPSFPVLHPDYCSIYHVPLKGRGEKEVLKKELGGKMAEFRKSLTPSLNDILLNKNPSSKWSERISFGLPLQYYRKEGVKEIKCSLNLGFERGGEVEEGRLPSPLVLKLKREGGRFHLIATIFKLSMLSEARLLIKGERRERENMSSIMSLINFKKLEDFVKGLGGRKIWPQTGEGR